ncbi:MAG: FAD:protein FMN transferase [Nanoarchaeota archaeon]
MEHSQLSKPLFGKELKLIAFNAPELITQEILEEAYLLGLKLQKIFNFYDKESELSLLNKNRSLKVSPDLLFVIKKAIEFSKLTKGRYDISLGKQFLQRKANQQSIALFPYSYKDIQIIKNKISLNHPEMILDLGSIAKGYIADKIADFLKEKGLSSFLVDARGDIIISGEPQKVNIQHPRDKEKSISSIEVKDSCIATSGDYYQYSKYFENSHILNQKDLCSVTVIAPTLTEADAFSTSLFVLSIKEREELIAKNPQIKVLTIDIKLNQKHYNCFSQLIREVNNEN